MAKPKAGGNVPNRPIYSRMSFLYQAAAYLSSQADPSPNRTSTSEDSASAADKDHVKRLAESQVHRDGAKEALSRRLITDMRSTSKKAQIRMSPALKHTICKYCDTLLVDGQNSTTSIENPSRGGKKPWADILVVNCHTCGGVKRFPVHAPRQKQRQLRQLESIDSAETPASTDAVSQGATTPYISTSA